MCDLRVLMPERREKGRKIMITGKQRSYLRKLGQQIDPTVYIGKSGLTENIRKELENNFEARELVKVKLQEGCDLDPKETANKLAADLGADFVQAIGRKFVLYKKTDDEKYKAKSIVLPRD